MNKALLVICFFLLLQLTSCCPKRSCTTVDEMYNVWFYNFSEEDIRTLVIKSYDRNSSALLSADSTNYRMSWVGDSTYQVILSRNIDISSKLEIKVKSLNKTYTISDFTTIQVVCRRCWLHSDPPVLQLESFSVNGQVQRDAVISLYR